MNQQKMGNGGEVGISMEERATKEIGDDLNNYLILFVNSIALPYFSTAVGSHSEKYLGAKFCVALWAAVVR